MEAPDFIPGSPPGCPSTHSLAMYLWKKLHTVTMTERHSVYN